MTDRIRYERLANTAPYEHISLSVDVECTNLNDTTVKKIVTRVDNYIKAIVTKQRKDRELADAQRKVAYAREELERIGQKGGELSEWEKQNKTGCEEVIKKAEITIGNIIREQDSWLDNDGAEEEVAS